MQAMRRFAVVAAARVVLACAAPGQVAQAPPAKPAGAVTPAPDTSLLRAHVNLVLVDVVVTDRNEPVRSLDRSRFHIYEDGREQTIASFEDHTPSAPAVAFQPAALPAHTFTNASLYPPATAVNVLLLDALNTPLANQMNVRSQMLDYMGGIAPGTPMAIFTLSSRLRMITGFTTDTAALVKALKNPRTATQSDVLHPESDQLLDQAMGDMANNSAAAANLTVDGISGLTAMQQFLTDLTSFQTDQRVSITLEAMQQLARFLSGIPGRKNLIWFSGSFPLAIDPNDALNSTFEAMRNYSDEIRETDELLSAARVAVYPVDARGLMTMNTADASYTASTNLTSAASGRTPRSIRNNPMVGNDEPNFMKQTMQEQASMAQIAQETGGKMFINTNELKGAVADAIANGSSYYTVGYVPASKVYDGQFHEIQVRVDGGYQLAYRDGYYADPPDAATLHNPGTTSLIVAATLHGAPASTQVLFQARILPANDPLLARADLPRGPAGDMAASLKGPLHRYVADVTVDAHTIAFDTAADGAHQAQVEFVLVAYNGDGDRVNYLDRGFALSIQPGQFAQVLAHGMHFRFALDLPAGSGFLRIAVHDLAAARAGSLEAPLLVPAQ